MKQKKKSNPISNTLINNVFQSRHKHQLNKSVTEKRSLYAGDISKAKLSKMEFIQYVSRVMAMLTALWLISF